MSVSKEALRGYVLEEVLAYLIRNAGYKLIVDSRQDPFYLTSRGSTLYVRGRGSNHQVDVLGQLEWIPAFTFPLRLFAEAKFRKSKTNLPTVRNAVGTVLDVNQLVNVQKGDKLPEKKYQYEYVIFSTSGFSRDSIDMAMAHQISLIDISGEEYGNLLQIIDYGCGQIVGILQSQKAEEGRMGPPPGSKLVLEVRRYLRKHLGTVPSEFYESQNSINHSISSTLDLIISAARVYDQLFVGMANGPSMLLLKADDPQKFIQYSNDSPRHKVKIGWNKRVDKGRTWTISPSDCPDRYKLSFRLPDALYSWIFQTPSRSILRAIQAKGTYFDNIYIYYKSEDRDNLFRLEFDPNSIDFSVVEPKVIIE